MLRNVPTLTHRARARSSYTFRYLLILLLSLPALAFAVEGIQVQGRGAVEAAPDMGTFTLHARQEGLDAGALTRALNDIVERVLEVTDKAGIERRDVRAAAVNIRPRYVRRGERSVVEGVVASRSITVTLRDLEDYVDLLEAALAAGINNTDPLLLDSSRRAELERKALELAMADALARADQVAAGFSVERGPLLDVIVNAQHAAPRLMMQEMRAAADAGPMEPGLLRIEQSLQATFAIVGGT